MPLFLLCGIGVERLKRSGQPRHSSPRAEMEGRGRLQAGKAPRKAAFRQYPLWMSLAAALGFSINHAEAAADPSGAREMTAVFIERQITVDGRLDEPEWNLATPATGFTQTEPKTGQPATERTEVRLLYNHEYLYVGVHCFDSLGAKGIVVNEIKRDYTPADNDVFTIGLDTFDDNRNAFMFGTNPGGAFRDIQAAENGAANNTDWNAIWYVKTTTDAQGWHVEMAIPFKTLRFPETDEQVWGVNFLRSIRRKNEETHWSPVPRQYRMSRISLAGILRGIRGIRQGRNLYVKPYLLAPLVRRRQDDLDFLPDVGLDVKYGVTSHLTLDLTANTDFSQVEADESQINLTRFSLFFPEKREFFLENAGVFQFGNWGQRGGPASARDMIPFFSRQIGIVDGRLAPVLGGARISGRAGKHTLGILSMQTDEFESTPSTNFSVARVRRDLLRQSDIGGIFVNKESGGRFNRTYGIDGNFTFFRALDISSSVLRTDTSETEGKNGAFDFSIGWRDRLLDIQGEHMRIGRNFNPEAGFVPRRALRKSTAKFGILPRPGERLPWIREFRPLVAVDYIADPGNILETRTVETTFATEFQNSAVLTFGRLATFERLRAPFEIRRGQRIRSGDHQFDEYSASFTSDRSRKVSGNLRMARGSFWDGDRNVWGGGFRFLGGYRLRAEVSWTYNDLDLPSGAFTTNLVTTRLNYAFSPTLFLNSLIQYNSSAREISSNIRFDFTYKPLSDIYLVYNERRSSTGELRERAFIAKLTYVLPF